MNKQKENLTATEMAKRRWEGVSAADRLAHANKMVKARVKAAKKRGAKKPLAS